MPICSLFYMSFYSWIKQFIDEGGMQVIASELGKIHKKPDRCVATQVYIWTSCNTIYFTENKGIV